MGDLQGAVQVAVQSLAHKHHDALAAFMHTFGQTTGGRAGGRA